MTRTIIIGDVHGCREELEELLGIVGTSTGDQYIFVGDIIDKGPDSLGTLRLVQGLVEKGAVCVCGNHESVAFERYRKGKLKTIEEEWAHKATKKDWAFIEQMPLLHRLKDGSVVVHGGFFPAFFTNHGGKIGDVPFNWHRGGGKRMDRMRRFTRIREIDPDTGNMVVMGDETPNTIHWAKWYDGREGFAFYGHAPWLNPPMAQVDKAAIGLDAGCVHGGRLYAAVIAEGRFPAQADLVYVDAQKQYAEVLKEYGV